MRTTTIFTVGLTAALMLAIVMSLPASAQPGFGNGFTLLSAASGLQPPTILQVKGGHHGGFHGGIGFGFGGPYGYGGYGGYGGYYPYYGDGYGYYEEGNNTCVWNGYNYRCYNSYKDVY